MRFKKRIIVLGAVVVVAAGSGMVVVTARAGQDEAARTAALHVVEPKPAEKHHAKAVPAARVYDEQVSAKVAVSHSEKAVASTGAPATSRPTATSASSES
jgi:hypothetical protein